VKPNFSLIVANWKMELSLNEALTYFSDYHDPFINIANSSGRRIVICPSFPALYPLKNMFDQTKIALGAQDCSAFRSGAYTGQVCSTSLSQLGCDYCIIGHSEQRTHCCQTNAIIAEKAQRLLEQNIQPILCIGESKQDYENKKSLSVLEKQLVSVITSIAEFELTEVPIYIAYEPVWAIGTGVIPSHDYLINIFDWLNQQTMAILGKERIVGLLYGGSVSEQTTSHFKEIQAISGLLVGKASLDFQKFNNIVNLYKNS